MSSSRVTVITQDDGLPALAQALDTDRMRPFLVQAAGLHLGDATDLCCSAEVLNHKPGERCTIRYTLAHSSRQEGLSNAVRVIGKLYRKPRLAECMYRRTQALNSGLFNHGGAMCTPAPLMLLPELGLVLQECVEGGDIRHVLAAGNSDGPLSLAAQWLARLHAASPLTGLETKSLEHELAKVDRWCDEIAPCLTSSDPDAQRLRRAQDSLHRLAREMSPYVPVMIHKDFYYANVLWDGQHVWVLDFDQMSMGDPALDVGHFLAHLKSLAYRTTDVAHSYAEPGRFFLDAYVDRAADNIHLRVPFYRAYTFLKLAATEASRKRMQWVQLTQVLTSLACREMDEPLGSP